MSYSAADGKILFTDFTQIDMSLKDLPLNLDPTYTQIEKSKSEIIDFFYILSNLLRPNLYAGFQKSINTSTYNLKFESGKILF